MAFPTEEHVSQQEKKTSPWVWVLGGCGCLLVGGGIAVVALGGWLFSEIRDIESTVRDPVKRASKTQEALGYEKLPDGYHPLIGLRIPFILELGVLTDRQPDAEGDIDGPVGAAFFYARLAKWVTRDKDLRDVFEGDGDPARLLDQIQTDISVRGEERIGEGEIRVNGQPVRYVAERGRMAVEGAALDGVFAMFVVKCEAGQRPGLGGWVLPEGGPDEPLETADFTGTPADPATLTAFLSAFELCR